MTLTLAVLPGMGHLYLKKKLKGYLFAGLSTGIVLAAFVRYMSVLFALANVRKTGRPPSIEPISLILEAIRLDWKVLLGFLLAFLLVYGVAAVDLMFLLKSGETK